MSGIAPPAIGFRTGASAAGAAGLPAATNVSGAILRGFTCCGIGADTSRRLQIQWPDASTYDLVYFTVDELLVSARCNIYLPAGTAVLAINQAGAQAGGTFRIDYDLLV